MKIDFRIAVFYLLLLLTLHACKDEHEAPKVALSILNDTTAYFTGDTLTLYITASDNVDLHEMYVKVWQPASSVIYLLDTPYVHGAQVWNRQYSFIDSLNQGGAWMFEVDVLDHDINTTHSELSFELQ